MRTFLFQCSTLMMIILVYSSPIYNCTNKEVCKALLRQIEEGASNLTNNIEMKLVKKMVPKISNEKTCAPRFFCLAEKVVQNIPNKPAKLSHLHELLVQYNNQTRETDCKMTSFGSYSLGDFLNNVEKCVKFTLFKKTSP